LEAGLESRCQYVVMRLNKRDQLTLVNVGQDTTLCDCDVAEEFIQFLVIADGELKMARDDTGLLVVTSCVTSQLKDFSC
jgi:hypothetical protein